MATKPAISPLLPSSEIRPSGWALTRSPLTLGRPTSTSGRPKHSASSWAPPRPPARRRRHFRWRRRILARAQGGGGGGGEQSVAGTFSLSHSRSPTFALLARSLARLPASSQLNKHSIRALLQSKLAPSCRPALALNRSMQKEERASVSRTLGLALLTCSLESSGSERAESALASVQAAGRLQWVRAHALASSEGAIWLRWRPSLYTAHMLKRLHLSVGPRLGQEGPGLCALLFVQPRLASPASAAGMGKSYCADCIDHFTCALGPLIVAAR